MRVTEAIEILKNLPDDVSEMGEKELEAINILQLFLEDDSDDDE